LTNFYIEEEDQILRSNRGTHTIPEIQALFQKRGFDRTLKSIEHRCSRLELRYVGSADDEEDNLVDDAWSLIEERAQQNNTLEIEGRISGTINGKPARKIVCIADTHIPFQRDELINQVIADHKGADYLVVAGDLLDLYCVSVFTKSRRIPLLREYQIAFDLLKKLSKNFKKVILIEGNHERRLHRHFTKNVSQESIAFVAQPVLERLAGGEVFREDGMLVNRQPFENVFYDRLSPAQARIGKTIFVHPDAYLGPTATGGALRTVGKADKHYRGKMEYDSVVCAHTHHVGSAVCDGVLLIETGCLCGLLDYQRADIKFRFGTQENGYAVIYQDIQGNTDFNMSRPIFLGSQWANRSGEYGQ
jgi:predicted phosphodiesterase